MELIEIVTAAFDRAIDTGVTSELDGAQMARQPDGIALILTDGRIALVTVRAARFEVVPA